MQRDRQLELLRFFCEALNAGDDSAGADRDTSGADAKPAGVIEYACGFEDRVIVVEWLAHTHEDDVGWTGVQLACGHEDLSDHFAGFKVASESGLAAGAEGALEAAAHLAGDADRVSLLARRQENGLHGIPIAQAHEEFAGLAGGE